jgi:hypothetical protein
MSVFDKFIPQAWPFRYEGRIRIVNEIHGGIPSDLVTIENFVKARMDKGNEQLIAEEMAKTVQEIWEARGKQGTAPAVPTEEDAQKITNEAITKVAKKVGASGFKRGRPMDGPDHWDSEREIGQLHYEGRCLKAALKEAISVAYAAGKILNKQKKDPKTGEGRNSWGRTNKQIGAFSAEHIQVAEEKLWLNMPDENGNMIPAFEPHGVNVHPVHLYNGNALSQEEYIEGAEFDFTIVTDWDFDEEFWAMVWLTGQLQGLGSSRSMGRGRYEVERWDSVEPIESLARV